MTERKAIDAGEAYWRRAKYLVDSLNNPLWRKPENHAKIAIVYYSPNPAADKLRLTKRLRRKLN